MNSESLFPSYTAPRSPRLGIFNTAMGQLQRQLRQGEFDIFKSVPMFESDFVQISRRGTLSNMHGCPQIMTVGIANTNPFDPIPNVMLVAQLVGDCEKHVGCDQDTEGEGDRDTKELELTRLLPLKLVKISIHNRDKLQLRVKLITGRSFYLQLWAPPDKQEELFGYWEELIYLLRPPVEAYSSTHAVPAGDLFMSVFEEMDRSPEVAYFQIREGQEEVSIGSIHALEATAALSAASARGKQAQQDFHKGMTVTKSASEQLTTALAGAATEWPGGRKTNAVIAGAANTCPPECTASGSAVLSPEDSVRMATAGAAPASKIGGGETGVSASPTSAPTLRREEAGRQVHLPPACTEVPNGFSSPAGMVADSHQRAGGDKIPHQPGDSTSDSLRALGEEEEGCCSSAHSRHDTTCKEVSPAHAPTAEESRASHKSGGTKSARSWPEIRSRIGSLWHNIKARVSGCAKPHRGGHSRQDMLGDHHKGDGQGLEAAGSRPWARSHKRDQGLGGDQGSGHTPTF
ncbi:Protein FAM71A [Manis javanica]|nr:Protein FAM71A [Manis javanica]